jgi:hypothetical protein
MNEVERLYYYNGRRLEAPDFLLEQRYHLEMRRLLNRELFTPGVVSGLEVTQKSKTRVAVADGLALDPRGREIVYPGGELDVPAQPPTALAGYLLVVRYTESQVPADEDPCLEPGIPRFALIREAPELSWTEQPPNHDYCRREVGTPLDCAVAIAFVRISNACEIEEKGIDPSIREFAHPTHTSQVSAIALEGEKDIDEKNPKELHFVVRGGTPSSVVLFLWGGRFSSLYYTEMGQHAHALSKIQVGAVTTSLPPHTHSLSNHTHGLPQVSGSTDNDGDHRHHLKVVSAIPGVAGATGWSDVVVRNRVPNENSTIAYSVAPFSDWIPQDGSANHAHKFSIAAGTSTGPSLAQTGSPENVQSVQSSAPSFSATIDPAGSPTYNVRGGAAYEYLDDMHVVLDGTDITKQILDRLAPKTDWQKLGQAGNPNHKLNTEGTGAIDLLEIANAIGEPIGLGAHKLVFKLAPEQGKPAKGGKVLYNLYVE